MASPQALQLLQQYPHRIPLDGDQIRTLCNALTSLRRILGEDNAIKTVIYTAILRVLKAHVTPLPTLAPVTFSQVQAARLQLLADQLIAEGKALPAQLTTAIAQGLVTGFDPATCTQIPPDRQKQQLAQQQRLEGQQIAEERQRLSDRHNDFTHTRAACVHVFRARERQQAGPDPHLFIPWHERIFRVSAPPPSTTVHSASDPASHQPTSPDIPPPCPPHDPQPNTVYPPLDTDVLTAERDRILNNATRTAVSDISAMLEAHRDGSQRLHARQAALLETRVRHAKLVALQHKMRQNVWSEHISERDSRRGNKGRARTLKQLQREFEKVDRARIRQIEAEERDARRKRQAWMNAMVDHLNKFRSYHRDVVRRGMRAVTKAVLKHHEEVARNASRAEREAEKARIQKLKEDDEEGYLKLVRETKNTRLLELLDQTDKYLKELGAVVREERAKSGVVEYENGREKQGSRVNYYEIAHAIKEDVHVQSSLLVGGKLKEYQLQGIQWMVSLYNNRLNGILADEMGLGKTIQTLGLIAHLMENKDNPGPYLIIVPLSTISNWEMEFARWAPAIRVVVFKGDLKRRRKLFEEIIEKNSFNVCLVTYEYVVRGKNLLKRIEWQHLVIDEGHRIKNHESRLSSVLHAHYRSRNRLLLTGTPLQNSLTELWALLNFLLPNVFKSAESFESWFAAPFAQMGVGNVATTDDQAQLTEEESLLIIRRLHQVLRPFLLRRMKTDVLRMGEQLPEKQEHVVLVEMSAWQRYMYLKIVKSESLLFTDKHGRQRYDKLPNPAVQLRKCVNHPYLFYADHASKIVDTPQLWRSSGKFDMLDSIVMKLLRTGHRILVFNQMTKVVDLQERLLRYRNIPFYRLDGTTGTDERKQMVNDFNDESTDVHVFLLTTRAGGLGVNLQTADTVIIFDSDWNPSMDQQAQDRAHRIGQRREVLVLRLLTNKSIEEDVMERASFKRGLEKKIIRAGMFDEQSKDSERQAMLRELLRVEGPGSDDDHPEDGLPTDEEVNRILARSEEEFRIFTDIDQERAEEVAPRPRLLIDKEIPEWATKVPKSLLIKAKTSGAGNWAGDADGLDLSLLNEPKKRRAATTNVSYGFDQLSESQYLKLVERSEAGEELSYDTLRAYTRRKKRRRKGEEPAKSDTGDDENNTENGDSAVRSSAVVSDDARKGSPTSDGAAVSKSVNTDLRSADDDVDGGENSCAPLVGDDMIIADEDDDDGEDVADDEKDGVESLHGDASSRSDGEVDSDFSGSSESQSDSPSTPIRGRKRVARRPGRRKGLLKRRKQTEETSETSDVPETIGYTRGSAEPPSAVQEAPPGDSSDESLAPIRRSATRKRPKGGVPNRRSVSVDQVGNAELDEALRAPALKKLRANDGGHASRAEENETEKGEADASTEPTEPAGKTSSDKTSSDKPPDCKPSLDATFPDRSSVDQSSVERPNAESMRRSISEERDAPVFTGKGVRSKSPSSRDYRATDGAKSNKSSLGSFHGDGLTADSGSIIPGNMKTAAQRSNVERGSTGKVPSVESSTATTKGRRIPPRNSLRSSEVAEYSKKRVDSEKVGVRYQGESSNPSTKVVESLTTKSHSPIKTGLTSKPVPSPKELSPSVPLPKLTPLPTIRKSGTNALSSISPVPRPSGERSPKKTNDVPPVPRKSSLSTSKQLRPSSKSSSSVPNAKLPTFANLPKLPSTLAKLSSAPLLNLSNPPVLPSLPASSRVAKTAPPKRFGPAPPSATRTVGSSRSPIPQTKPSALKRTPVEGTLSKAGTNHVVMQRREHGDIVRERSSRFAAASESMKYTPLSAPKRKSSKPVDDAEDGEIREDGELSEDGEVAKVPMPTQQRPPRHVPVGKLPAKNISSSGGPVIHPKSASMVIPPKEPMPVRASIAGNIRPVGVPPPSRMMGAVHDRSMGPSIAGRGGPPSLAHAMAPPMSRPGGPPIGRPSAMGRGAMPMRGPMSSGPIINPPVRPTGPPTTAPIIAMPTINPPGGLPMGMGPPGAIMNHRMGPPPMMPMGQGVNAPYVGYGMRNGPGYVGGVGICGPPPPVAGMSNMRHGMHGYRPPYNGRLPATTVPPPVRRGAPSPPMAATPTSSSANSAKTGAKLVGNHNGANSGTVGSNEGTGKDIRLRKVVKHGSGAGGDPVKKGRIIGVKDVENGEEGEIEEDGEIVEAS